MKPVHAYISQLPPSRMFQSFWQSPVVNQARAEFPIRPTNFQVCPTNFVLYPTNLCQIWPFFLLQNEHFPLQARKAIGFEDCFTFQFLFARFSKETISSHDILSHQLFFSKSFTHAIKALCDATGANKVTEASHQNMAAPRGTSWGCSAYVDSM